MVSLSLANAFLVNGAEVNETKNMGAGMIPDADSVAEFRLITNSFSAEYGKFTGSVMNTVTKSGTNSFHGTLFEFYRNQKLDAINYFDSTKAELKRHQFGGVLGRPHLEGSALLLHRLSANPPGSGCQHGCGAGSQCGRTERDLFRCHPEYPCPGRRLGRNLAEPRRRSDQRRRRGVPAPGLHPHHVQPTRYAGDDHRQYRRQRARSQHLCLY